MQLSHNLDSFLLEFSKDQKAKTKIVVSIDKSKAGVKNEKVLPLENFPKKVINGKPANSKPLNGHSKTSPTFQEINSKTQQLKKQV